LKKLKIYKNDEGEFVLERINEFHNATKRYCENQEELIDALRIYPSLEDYQIEVDQNLWSIITNALQD